MTQRLGHDYSCLGRLKPDASLQEAKADLELIQQNLVTLYPKTDLGFRVRLVPYLDMAMGSYSATIWLVEVAVACLLLITCANVANLVLARAQDRRKNLRIRAALGSHRARRIVQHRLQCSI